MSSSSSQSDSSYYAMDNQAAWQFPTIIEDVDITFDGKPLSALYEEDRRRLSATSSSDEEEERRGRQRVRQEYSSSSHSSKKN
ncbi:hypothetical protein MKZ38_002307 [Zalerion maritima]|uniref:Uncharacterized protein n=1 Tax=Zalerion maritima TaxID=339359 RepID=A0AAD5RQI7_9PEZI|nr:hypothetical protein MKZ38_002307 [Zalerion maritima]